MKSKIAWAILLTAALSACDENTGSLGISADIDQISNTTANYSVYTHSLLMDKNIIANNPNSFLGRITDEETGSVVEADFVAQYQVFENFSLPKKNLMVDASDPADVKKGVVKCDSCDIRLYFDDFYGDADNVMKLQVFQLSTNPERMLNEDSVYYTDTDLTQFLDDDAKPVTTRMFSPTDFQVDINDRNDDNYQKNIHMMMPREFGQRIMDLYYQDQSNFQDSYHFTHNVLPGLYFHCSDGNGTMLKVYVGTMNLYFHYMDEENDSIYSGMTRFAATPEVIQSTSFKNIGGLQSLVEDNSCTYLKTPAGIATEVQLPINEIFSGEHAIDSVSMASITFTRYNKDQGGEHMGVPSELLMIRKSDMNSFFMNREIANNRTNYVTSYSSVYNSYTFSNISRLISFCMHEKVDAILQRLAAKGLTNYTEAQYKAEEYDYETENPDWNKVVLVPVETSSVSSPMGNILVSVNHDMNLNSVRLVGGTTPVQLQVVYSRFRQ